MKDNPSSVHRSSFRVHHLPAFTALLFLALVAYASIALLRPPAAVPADAPADVFSSGRAMKHLRAVAERPHPTGSEANALVREYILRELAAQGLSQEVQEAVGVYEGRGEGRPITAATVRNVLARLRGTDGGGSGNTSSRAVMLAAHYDSVATAPGAGDDGAGVAALLETLRAVRAGAPPRNDLIFLFTDGEELGLLGAEAFAREHPWMRDVAIVLNFEGRGHAGASMMFETSEGNGWLVGELARAAPRPVANSLMYSLYRLLPNDTDMTVFKRAGAAGLNFAFADGVTHYHTMLDTPDELDERSLQHHGSQAQALARHFGGLDLGRTRAPDAVYFDLFGGVLVRYPESWVAPITLLLTLLLAVVVAIGLMKKSLTGAGMLLGFVALPACMAVVYAVGAVFRRALPLLHRDFQALPSATPYNAWLYELGLVLVAFGATAAVFARLGRRAGFESLWAGALVCWLVLLLAATAWLPAGSFLFAWPLLFASLGLAYVVFAGESSVRPSWRRVAVLALSVAPGVALVAPVVYMLFVMLGLGLPGVLLLPVVLLAGLLVPQLSLLTARGRRLLPLTALAAGVVLILAGVLTVGYDARRRKTDSVFYFLNADTGRARWVSADAALDEWTSQFFAEGARRESLSDVFPWVSQTAFQAEAPPVALPPPELEVLQDGGLGRVRTLRLRLASPRGAPLLTAYTNPESEVLRASVGGHLVADRTTATGETAKPFRLSYAAPDAGGLELVLEVKASRPLSLTVQDTSYELPQGPGFDYRPRPAHLMPLPSSRASETTIISKTFVLDKR